jgi:hypothetical protein
MLVQIWLGVINNLIYAWGFVDASHQRRVKRHESKALKSTSAAAADDETKAKD